MALETIDTWSFTQGMLAAQTVKRIRVMNNTSVVFPNDAKELDLVNEITEQDVETETLKEV
jgi:hypothetical protein